MCWPQGWLVLLPNVNVPKCSYSVTAMYLKYALTLHCVGILKPMFFEYKQFLLWKHEGFYYKESCHPNHKFFVWFFTPKFMTSTSIVITITMNRNRMYHPILCFSFVTCCWLMETSCLFPQSTQGLEQNSKMRTNFGLEIPKRCWCLIKLNLTHNLLQLIRVWNPTVACMLNIEQMH